MKRISILILLVILSSFLFSQTVKIGFFHGYPTNFIDEKSGEVTGHTIEYLKDFITEIGYDIEFIGPLPFPRLLGLLKSGEIDALLGMSKIKEREEYVYYPDESYRVSVPNIFVLNESEINEEMDSSELSKYTYSSRNGAALPGILIEIENILEITYLSRDTWIDQSLQMLELGRIDGIINESELSIIAAAKRLGLHNKIKMIMLPGNLDSLYLGISRNSPIGSEFIKKYNLNLKNTELDMADYDDLDF